MNQRMPEPICRSRAIIQRSRSAGLCGPPYHPAAGHSGVEAHPLAKKPNYDFEKRKKEAERKKKKDAKREDRLQRSRENAGDGTDGEAQADGSGETDNGGMPTP